jgi:predicted phage terminase large subunit-like protein
MIDAFSFVPVDGANYSFDYEKIVAEINELASGDEKKLLHFMRYWCEEDLFFLLYFILHVPVNHPFLVDRIAEVQECNNRTVDLWAREFYKSTIITYGLNIQHILRDPNVRIGIFSHTRSIAKAFLRRVKLTFEGNDLLKALFPDILYQNPTSQSPKWSEDDGILVNRPSVFQESTVEAWGLTDGQPTSKHFSILNYDDIVTIDSVRTADQLKKTDDCFKMSANLGADDGVQRVIGTIYHFNDQHIKLMQQGGWIIRKHPAEDEDGRPTFLPEHKLAKKRRDLGPYVYSTQMLLNPIAKKDQRFKYEWLKWYRTLPPDLSLYLLCDPANEKKRRSTGGDYTVFWLWGLDGNDNKFLVDVIRDRLTLPERWKALKAIRKQHPRIQRIGYEQYGMAADIQHYEEMMAVEGVYFNIIELAGNKLSKEDRIARLIPAFEQGRVYLPEHLEYEDKEGNVIDLVKVFVDEEYLRFPFSQHDDLLDAASRIEDKVLDASGPVDDYGYENDDMVQHDVNNFFNRYRQDEESGRDYITGY